MCNVKLFNYREIQFQTENAGPVIYDCCRVSVSSGGQAVQYQLGAFWKAEGTYAVRILADRPGDYHYEIHAGEASLAGSFSCPEQEKEEGGRPDGSKAEGGKAGGSKSEDGKADGRKADCSRGIVRTAGDGFVYSDGSKYLPFGTTCYGWINQKKELQEETLKTLQTSCFNKIRMLIFPKFMPFNQEDPALYPYEKTAAGQWDISCPVQEFWDNLDLRLNQLNALGIQADLILFHPYDKWGFAELSQADSLSYLDYCIARFAALPNIWWSLANEYEMLLTKKEEDWDEYGRRLAEKDVYHHLISIHQILKMYPKKPWMTHCSIQTGSINYIPIWKTKYPMPILIDECGYEGDIEFDWGNLSPQEMVHRFWWTVTRGGYCTHGETYYREDEVLWWGKGGKLYGSSEPRIAFLKNLLEELPGVGKAAAFDGFHHPNRKPDNEMTPGDIRFVQLIGETSPELRAGVYDANEKALQGDGWKLRYFGHTCPGYAWIDTGDLSGNPAGNPTGEKAAGEENKKVKFRIEVIDTWNMTREVLGTDFCGKVRIKLPGREGMAVLMIAE